MPITQEPSLSIVDLEQRQFEISFGLLAQDHENIQTVSVPNIEGGDGALYSIDLMRILSPARGNVPSIRALGFSINQFIVSTPTVDVPMYIWNSESNQAYSFLPPLTSTATAQYPGNINGVVPFYCKPTQTIQVFRKSGSNPAFNTGCVVACNFVLFTFDVPAFYTINQPNVNT